MVVTGASRGVGYASGRELATRMPGAAVYLTTRQANLAALDTNLRRDIGVAADNARFRFMDLKDRRSIHKFVDIVKPSGDTTAWTSSSTTRASTTSRQPRSMRQTRRCT